ncbi:MAG: PD-(D/E)XK nuclease family protein, partial [Candidatus Binatia bacterium]
TWQGLLKKFLAIGAASDSATAPLHEKIIDLLDQLAGLDAIESRVSLSDFSRTFQHWLERTEIEPTAANRDGVAVLNATAARGLPFRALFVLGLNEGVFPRTIREDAFLRDRDREILERDLGYKISQKLAAFDEEKLLFTLLASAARERLYCSFQRADDNGRALAPSWYVNELERSLDGGDHVKWLTIPRSSADKIAIELFNRESLLLPEELAIRQSLEGQDPIKLIEACALSPALYRQGRKVVVALDQSADRLQPFDGAVGALENYWQHFSERGLVPTALETYARCPFQFFARHVLGLQRLDQPEAVLGPSPAEFGELGHAILNGFFASLIERGHLTGQHSTSDLDTLLSAIARQKLAEYEVQNPVGYPLAWETLKEGLVALIGQVIRKDLGELAASGYQPVELEINESDQLPSDWPDPLKQLKIRGRMDRIDRNAEHNRLRVIDYKFKFGANPTAQDRSLDRAAVRGERLQPPIYLLLGQHWAETNGANAGATEVSAQFYFIAPRWSDGPLVSSEFRAVGMTGNLGAEIKNTIAELVRGIQSGSFFIRPGEYCGHCEVAEICRKNHPPSLWRAENDPVTQAHRQLRDKDPKKL